MKKWIAAIVASAMVASAAQAAFIVTPFGIGSGNFSGTPRSSTAVSSAEGVTGNSAFGSTTASHTYEFSFTPGVDNFFTNAFLGDTGIIDTNNVFPLTPDQQFGTGLASETGMYRVWITWPSSGNVSGGGSTLTITNDGPDVVLSPVDQNSTADNGPTPSGVAGADKWALLAEVHLTVGNTYTVTMEPLSATFVSQRVNGVMWEFVPEPGSLMLLGFGALGLLWRRRTVR